MERTRRRLMDARSRNLQQDSNIEIITYYESPSKDEQIWTWEYNGEKHDSRFRTVGTIFALTCKCGFAEIRECGDGKKFDVKNEHLVSYNLCIDLPLTDYFKEVG